MTGDDEEKWSFLFRTKGSRDYVWCAWEEVQDEEYDGDPSILEDRLSPERLEELEKGGNLTEAELELWRRATCEGYADGTNRAWLAWVVPVSVQRVGC
jgi:hypothetical protein